MVNIRARAFALRTPRCKRNYHAIFSQRDLLIFKKHVNRVRMNDSLLSSPVLREHKLGMEWKTPERSKIRGWRADGKSYGKIMEMCGGLTVITRSAI